jgi:hypothetical protein
MSLVYDLSRQTRLTINRVALLVSRRPFIQQISDCRIDSRRR